ncbi:MAG: ketoacyl-ACP synthase III [Nitrospirae bacterium]|nr:ketoacyl-ACP synthase III [Nitrospirota bacterium]
MKRSRIIGTGSYVPARVLTNHDLEKLVDTTDAWITERTGIKERRIAGPDETTSELALRAARLALGAAHVKPREIDLVLVATATPDMFFPATACLVQDRLGARTGPAFDISAACSGFIYGLSVADQYIKTGAARTVLLIGAELFSRIVDWTDRSTCVLFGDGAGAVVLRADSAKHGLLSVHLHADGSQWELLNVPSVGSIVGGGPPTALDQVRSAKTAPRPQTIRMKGNETFRVAVRTLEQAAREALEANQLDASDIALLIPHQANMRIIQATAKRLGLPMSRVFVNLDRYGNTSAASIPIALDEAVREHRLSEGEIVLFEAFGGGLTWGSAVVRW